MYRRPIFNQTAVLDAQSRAGRHAGKAVLFASIAIIAKSLNIQSGTLSLLGMHIPFEGSLMINGVLCLLSIFYGFVTLIAFADMVLHGGLQLSNRNINRRILAHVRNRKKFIAPYVIKKTAKVLLYLTIAPMAAGFLFLLSIYIFGVSSTFGEAIGFIRLILA